MAEQAADLKENKAKATNVDHVLPPLSEDNHTMGEEGPVTTTSPTQGDRKDGGGDVLEVGLEEESPDTEIGPGGDNGEGQGCVLPTEKVTVLKKEVCSPTSSANRIIEGMNSNTEIIGPTTEDTMGPSFSDVKETVEGLSSLSKSTNSEAENNSDESKEQADIKKEDHACEVKAQETNQADRSDDHVDGPHAGLCEESPGFTDTEPLEDDERSQGHVLISDTQTDPEETEKQINVRTLRSAFHEINEPSDAAGICAGRIKYLIAAIVVVVAIIVPCLLEPVSPPQTNDVRQIDILLEQLEKVKTQFPTQRDELWKRSRIHLQRHLLTVQPTEPVSLILTAGLKAEKTLHCLAQDMASAYSSALNASVLHIDGSSKASQDSDQVKLDIDRKLQGAFEGDKPVAVIHRFEELPPGSTLIFYRYCDHENAAYKNNFLIFTVLLGEEEEIPAKIRLSTVEEMVDDHLRKKFLSHGHPVSFDRMDLDKYGGLWSRISHLILPVAAEEDIERDGCKET